MSVSFPETSLRVLDRGFRTFVPFELVEDFLLDFIRSYPEAECADPHIEMGSALHPLERDAEYLQLTDGTWFYYDMVFCIFFFKAHQEGMYRNVPLASVWRSPLSAPLPRPIPLDLSFLSS